MRLYFANTSIGTQKGPRIGVQKGPLSDVRCGLVQVANRRDPRAAWSALTSDGTTRAGGACLPTWASLRGGAVGEGTASVRISCGS